MKNAVIVGAGGFAKEVLALIRDCNKFLDSQNVINIIGFISPESSEDKINDIAIIGNDEWAKKHLPRDTYFTIAIGESRMRKKLSESWTEMGFSPLTLIHPSVIHSEYTYIKQGSIICARSTLTSDIYIGEFVLINLHCTIGHDSVIENWVTLSPGVHVSGQVTIKAQSEIGTGATILPGLSIGTECVLGAGAVVTKNLLGGKTYIGCPAKEMFK